MLANTPDGYWPNDFVQIEYERMTLSTTTFPFTAIIGMDLAKHSLLYHAIDPKLGGVVLMGHRGCAKSTLVRAFQEILPAEGSGTAPFVEVPLGASEDRLLGAVDATQLVEQGNWREQPGLLEQAHRGTLYIDEVNLLPDHLVDLTLDAAASGQYRLERDGLSRQVDARFILVGTMNPEEGDLRPQLLDRFTHGVLIRDDYTPEERREIVRARMAFEDDPEGFRAEHATSLEKLQQKLRTARERLRTIRISEEVRTAVAEQAAALQMEGVRAELGVLRTARCAAAWRGDKAINENDLAEGWTLCLAHRQVSKPQTPPPPTPPSTQPPQSETSSRADSAHSPLMTAPTPQHARRDAIQLEPVAPSAMNPLQEWWNRPVPAPKRPLPVTGASRMVARPEAGSRVDWCATVRESLKRGWQVGEQLSLRSRKPQRQPLVWLFVDASRSAGALKFLGAAREAIRNLGLRQAARRFQILLLQHDELEWRVKRGTAQAADRCLANLTEASGKSLLHHALWKLTQAVQKAGVLPGDRVLLCSDGLFTPASGASLPKEKLRFRRQLQRLTQRIPGVAWLHPTPKHGMQRWIPELASGTPVQLIHQ